MLVMKSEVLAQEDSKVEKYDKVYKLFDIKEHMTRIDELRKSKNISIANKIRKTTKSKSMIAMTMKEIKIMLLISKVFIEELEL